MNVLNESGAGLRRNSWQSRSSRLHRGCAQGRLHRHRDLSKAGHYSHRHGPDADVGQSLPKDCNRPCVRTGEGPPVLNSVPVKSVPSPLSPATSGAAKGALYILAALATAALAYFGLK